MDETLDNTEMTLPVEVSRGEHDTTDITEQYVLVHQIVSTKQAAAAP